MIVSHLLLVVFLILLSFSFFAAAIDNYDFESKTFIIYGENTNDEKIETKYSQLKGLGFTKLYLYRGGMFEWLLLQDIYGTDEFPTTSKLLDILQYRPTRTIS